MAETAFLTAIRDFLADQAGLVPAPATVGLAEPVAAADLPALVLSLEGARRPGGGIGAVGRLMTDGALPIEARIDLANPVLPEEPTFRLLSTDRRELILPHGGLVRANTTSGTLGPADLVVTVDGATRAVVTGEPGPGEVRAEPTEGRLRFGDPLPPSGQLVARYFLGQWEQRLVRLTGVLRLDCCAAAAADVAALSDAVVEALTGEAVRSAVRRLLAIDVAELGSIGPPESAAAGARRRSARFPFEFEQEINRPESSGGIIRRIPVTTHLRSLTVAGAGGGVVEAVVTEIS